jgi:O-antigen/teichoic acid export membrane protein
MSRYLISAIEQALWSVLNLGVNLLLIRLAAPVEYGAFAFWANVGFVLTSIQNALTVCHLQVLAPGDHLDAPRLGVERIMHGVTIAYIAVVTVAALAAVVLLHGAGSPLGAPAAVLFLPAFVLQQYIRALAFTRDRPAVAATQTTMVLVSALALLGVALLAKAMTAERILLCLGLAYAGVGVVGAFAATRRQWAGMDWRGLAHFGGYVRQSAWVFLGVTSTELLTRFYAFVVAGWYGPIALASLAATQQLLRPVPLLASSWSLVARTDLARRREAGDWAGMARITVLTGVGGVVIAAAWALIIFAGWSVISRYLFGGKYAGDGWMVLLWGLAAAIGFAQVVVSAALQALKAFKPLALANAAASIVAAGAILAIMQIAGYRGAIMGTAVGQMMELVVMAVVLGTMLRGLGTAKRVESD